MKTLHQRHLIAPRLASLALIASLLAAPITVASNPLLRLNGSAAPRLPQRCEAPAFGRDRLAVVCMLEDATLQQVHIKVHFTGSHDDTTASLEVAIGGAPVACSSDSKTNTEFEDGDVTLDCLLTASVKPGTARDLQVLAKWFHAQYVNFEMSWRLP